MPLKTTGTVGLRRSIRQRRALQADQAIEDSQPEPMARRAAMKRARRERRRAEMHSRNKHEKHQKHQPQAEPMHGVLPTASPTPESLDPSLDEDDRSAVDILATLYHTGIMATMSEPEPASSCSSLQDDYFGDPPLSPAASLEIPTDDAPFFGFALPSMYQTTAILHSWRADCNRKNGGKKIISKADAARMDLANLDIVNGDMDNVDDLNVETKPICPPTPGSLSDRGCAKPSAELQSYTTSSSRASSVSPLLLPRPGSSPPAYSEWRGRGYVSPPRTFAECEKSYFSPAHRHIPSAIRGMPSPPQSPDGSVCMTDFCFRTNDLPTPPPSYATAVMQQQSVDSIATTVVTLPPAGVAGEQPLTPMSPLSLPTALDHDGSDKMAAATTTATTATAVAKLEKKDKPSRKADLIPKPHCNVKYETAELDFIMYQRCTKNRAWDDVTSSFNAALPRLRQYAEMDYLRQSQAQGQAGSGSAGDKLAADRYRPRPERTTPGLQASYYRQRLALPLLDEAGRLVFDEQTNKQIFTEVMVRDDKSRKMRRLNRLNGGCRKPADDTRVHLVLYFPERVAHYDYWFVTDEDKALARQQAYERNMQRAERGIPAWVPGNDDPETGILIRSKEA